MANMAERWTYEKKGQLILTAIVEIVLEPNHAFMHSPLKTVQTQIQSVHISSFISSRNAR